MPENKGSLLYLKKAIRHSWQVADCQAFSERRGFYMPIFGKGIEDYKITFGALWPDSIRQGGTAIDIMGDGEYIRDLQRSGNKIRGIGLALTDTRSFENKDYDQKNGNIFITGDIMKSKTWAILRDKLDGRTADLIACRGAGGLDFLPKDYNAGGVLLKRFLSLLNTKGGSFISQITKYDDPYQENIAKWLTDTGLNTNFELTIPEVHERSFWPVIRIDSRYQ